MFALAPDYVGYNSYIALIDAAWNALIDRDPATLNLRALSRSAGLSPSLAHRHFKTKGDLFAAVAGAGLQTLWSNIHDADDLATFAQAWLKFALYRPRHYLLMFAPDYAEQVAWRRETISKCVRHHVEARLKRPAHRHEVGTVFAMLHGTASYATSTRQELTLLEVLSALEAYFAARPST